MIKAFIALAGSKMKVKHHAVYDTACKYSCIRQDLAEKLGLVDRLPNPLCLYTSTSKDFLNVKYVIRLNFEINGVRLSDEFMVAPFYPKK